MNITPPQVITTVTLHLHEYDSPFLKTVVALPASRQWLTDNQELHEIPSSTVPTAVVYSPYNQLG